MKPQPPLNRRGFLAVSAASATFGGLLNSGRLKLRAAPPNPNTTGETDHFWYRLAPEGPYVDSQRDHKAFGFSEGKIFLSEDNCRTWAHSAAFPDAEHITFSCLLTNGNIL